MNVQRINYSKFVEFIDNTKNDPCSKSLIFREPRFSPIAGVAAPLNCGNVSPCSSLFVCSNSAKNSNYSVYQNVNKCGVKFEKHDHCLSNQCKEYGVNILNRGEVNRYSVAKYGPDFSDDSCSANEYKFSVGSRSGSLGSNSLKYREHNNKNIVDKELSRKKVIHDVDSGCSELDYSKLSKNLENEIKKSKSKSNLNHNKDNKDMYDENENENENENRSSIYKRNVYGGVSSGNKFCGQIRFDVPKNNVNVKIPAKNRVLVDDFSADSSSESVNINQVYIEGNKKFNSLSRPGNDFSTENMILNDNGPERIIGKIMYDLPKKCAASPKDRVLVDDFCTGVDAKCTDDTKIVGHIMFDVPRGRKEKEEVEHKNSNIGESRINNRVDNNSCIDSNINTVLEKKHETAMSESKVCKENVQYVENILEKEHINNAAEEEEDKMVSKVTWNNIVNVKYIYDNKDTESIEKIRDNLHFCVFKFTNIHGENFMSTFSLYQNHVDLSICRAYDLTLDGNEINESNVEVVGDFLHMKILLYSFVGKKKNKKLIYNSLTEYEIWGIKNKNEHYLFYLEKNDNKKIEVKLGNENDTEIDSPKDYLEAEIMYSQSPMITSLLKIQIRENKLYINIKFNDIFPKLYSTNYCNMHINIFKG